MSPSAWTPSINQTIVRRYRHAWRGWNKISHYVMASNTLQYASTKLCSTVVSFPLREWEVPGSIPAGIKVFFSCLIIFFFFESKLLEENKKRPKTAIESFTMKLLIVGKKQFYKSNKKSQQCWLGLNSRHPTHIPDALTTQLLGLLIQSMGRALQKIFQCTIAKLGSAKLAGVARCHHPDLLLYGQSVGHHIKLRWRLIFI